MNVDASAPMNGDTWKDLDPRRNGREIKILNILPAQGVAQIQSASGKGPQVKIRLDRFKASKSKNGETGKKGYVLVSRANAHTHSPLGYGGVDGVLRDAMNELHPGIDLD